jgi:type III pantothenate kinase
MVAIVAAVDIGNTRMHAGFYRGDRLVSSISIPTQAPAPIIEKAFAGKNIEGAAIASVVPVRGRRLDVYLEKRFRIRPIIISHRLKLPFVIRYHRPRDLGADRIAASAGAYLRYSRNVIVVDLGTATTIDVVLANGVHAGGIIAPGIGTSAWALAQKAALLRRENLSRQPAVIGTSTAGCVRSGILNGTSHMVRGFIRDIRKKFRRNFLCVATGGWGKFAKRTVPEIDRFDPDLCLFGIMRIYRANI